MAHRFTFQDPIAALVAMRSLGVRVMWTYRSHVAGGYISIAVNEKQLMDLARRVYAPDYCQSIYVDDVCRCKKDTPHQCERVYSDMAQDKKALMQDLRLWPQEKEGES